MKTICKVFWEERKRINLILSSEKRKMKSKFLMMKLIERCIFQMNNSIVLNAAHVTKTLISFLKYRINWGIIASKAFFIEICFLIKEKHLTLQVE